MAYTQFTGGERYPSWNSAKENKDFKEGAILEGIYKSKREVRTANGVSMLYAVETPKEIMGVWGTKILDDFFGAMPIGTQIKLTYLGLLQPKKGGRPYHGYQCDYDKETMEKVVPMDPDTKLVKEAVDETFGPES